MLARTAVSLILIPATLAVLYLAPPSAFVIALLLVALGGLAEYIRLVPIQARPRRQWWLMGIAASVVIAGGWGPATSGPQRIMAAFAIGSLAVALQVLFSVSDRERALAVVSTSVFGLMYVPVFVALLIPVRFESGNGGTTAILFLLLVTWAGDVGVYLAGRIAGRHKLAPLISPGKTVEGAVAGLGCSVCVGLLFSRLVSGQWNWLAAAALNVAGQSGDLFESMLKRGAGVKDSSRLLPGHGGILDRIDSLLFCCPLLFVFQMVRGF